MTMTKESVTAILEVAKNLHEEMADNPFWCGYDYDESSGVAGLIEDLFKVSEKVGRPEDPATLEDAFWQGLPEDA